MKTFAKNLCVMVAALAIVLIAAYLRRVEPYWVEIGLTFLLPFGVVVLVLEDFFRKRQEDKIRPEGARRKANLEHVVGMFLIWGSITAFFWASQGVTYVEMYQRLALTFFSTALVIANYSILYPRSLKSAGELEQERWRKIRPGIIKLAQTDRVAAEKRIHRFLRYACVGNRLDGDLDLRRPIALYEKKPITYAKALSFPNEDGHLTDLLANFENYIKSLFSIDD